MTTTDANNKYLVLQDSLGAAGENTWASGRANKMGFQIVTDFYTQMALEGRCYQVRAGTVTTPLTGDEAISDTAAEMCADAATGTTIMPYSCGITLDAMGGDALEIAGKSVATVSSGGDAFIPLPLLAGGNACASTARVDPAGGCTVTAELATTTLRHFEWSAEFVVDAGTEGPMPGNPFLWEPRVPPILVGPRCFYVQIASATTGPVYFAHFDFIELPTTAVS